MDASRRVCIRVVGDAGVGKSSMVLGFAGPADLKASSERKSLCTCTTELRIGEEIVSVEIVDGVGDSEARQGGPDLTKPDWQDAYIVAFSLIEKASLKSAEEKWVKWVENRCSPGCPFVVVGTKLDQCSVVGSENAVDVKVAESMATRVGASAFVACSSKSKEGLSEVFERAARLAYAYKCSKEVEIFGPGTCARLAAACVIS